jgi:hypothetical protein
MLLLAPKGCRENEKLGLLRFLELLALAEGETVPEDTAVLQGELGPHQFLLFLARHYAGLLQDLCRRDFRSYYHHEEGELRGRIRGRLAFPQYARLALRGRPHLLPCRWDEFTVDNWDNRILWAAARRLKQVAGAFDSKAATLIWTPFENVSPWFNSVAEVQITPLDFHKSHLGRTSRYYRHALAWARLLIQGSDLPTLSGQVPPLVLSSHQAFEKFAEAVARAATPEIWRGEFQEAWVFLSGSQLQKHQPDITLWGPGSVAVGDAKYKEVLEVAAVGTEFKSGEEAQAYIQPPDWNQLYVYMRVKKASSGFFIVPFWNAEGKLIEWLEDFQFAVPPCEGNVRVAVLALNLLRPLREVKQQAAVSLREWLLAAS